MIKIIIVDDHQMLIDGLRSLLRKEKNIDIIAEASNGADALELIRKTPPDVLITDISMPEMSGIELISYVKAEFPDVKTLVLTMYNDRQIITEIIKAEAEGFILKNTGKDELLAAINRVADNGTYYCNEVINILRTGLAANNVEVKVKSKEDLSSREIEVLKLICQENSSAEIAEKLFISPHTVDTHRKNILHKTKSKTIVGLIRYALDNRIVN